MRHCQGDDDEINNETTTTMNVVYDSLILDIESQGEQHSLTSW
jgi:hypothetical protein